MYTHSSNIFCFCSSYKWKKNNNNSFPSLISTKALRCSLFFHLEMFRFGVFFCCCCCHHFYLPVQFKFYTLCITYTSYTFSYYVDCIPLTLPCHLFCATHLYLFISIRFNSFLYGKTSENITSSQYTFTNYFFIIRVLGEKHSIHLKTFSKVNNGLVC